MAKVLKFTQRSSGVWDYVDEDQGVYEPQGAYSRYLARTEDRSASIAGRLRGAVYRASAYPTVPLQSEGSGWWGRVEEEYVFPFERREAPPFHPTFVSGGGPARVSEFPTAQWEYYLE